MWMWLWTCEWIQGVSLGRLWLRSWGLYLPCLRESFFFHTMVNAIWVIVCLLVAAAQAYIPDNMISDYLQSHNSRRCLHGTSDLIWSETVEDSAQTYANQCQFSHESQNTYGENLYTSSFNPSSENVLTGWYNDEEPQYNYASPGFSSGTGHFTAVCQLKPHDFLTSDALTSGAVAAWRAHSVPHAEACPLLCPDGICHVLLFLLSAYGNF